MSNRSASVMAANPVPLPQPTHRKVRDAAVLAGAFLVGAVTGVGLCAVAFGRDLFDRLPR